MTMRIDGSPVVEVTNNANANNAANNNNNNANDERKEVKMTNEDKKAKAKTAKQLRTLSYNAYNALVEYQKQLTDGKNPSLDDLVKAIAPCLRAFGISEANAGDVQLINQRIVSYGKKGDMRGWKMLGVGSFRNLLKRWNDEEGANGVIAYANDKRDPNAAAKEKVKGPTKAQIEDENKRLAAMIERLQSQVEALNNATA